MFFPRLSCRKSSHTTCLSGDMPPVRVSGQVAWSYTKGFPALHGTKVMQSGHLPSDLEKPGGFNLEGTLAADRVGWMISFNSLFRMSAYTELVAHPMSPKRRHLHEYYEIINWMLTGLSEHFKEALSWERAIYVCSLTVFPPPPPPPPQKKKKKKNKKS